MGLPHLALKDSEKVLQKMINEYIGRKVALKDMQPCLICGKPSTTVLYNSSGPDWFYTCDIHLKDNPQFVIPLYGKDYEDALSKLRELKSQLNNAKISQSGSWDGWVSSIFVKNKSKGKGKESESGKTSDATSADIESETHESSKDVADPMDKVKKLQTSYENQVDMVTDLQSKNKRYQLSKTTFESRVLKKKNEQIVAAKRKREQEAYTRTDPEELMHKFSFPTVPKS
ncbi:hypothetical protein HG535_0G01940 [Zygotorulaspora mrakii]|uniref:VPS4-associated protein 1 n=1 Tax=Zygotorulaspora mrakii TaxID=42260 RepID=A0A7H9B6Z6_ZYGMR|nr:uncharacterized protein HG535_0G01940 [Zygotorulaspora mrakii]QLG74310.1 hypothetical protein HG535_0G01940 [Zygotorulaspora mrakii]